MDDQPMLDDSRCSNRDSFVIDIQREGSSISHPSSSRLQELSPKSSLSSEISTRNYRFSGKLKINEVSSLERIQSGSVKLMNSCFIGSDRGTHFFDLLDRHYQWWNKIFLVSCVMAVSIDALFFYIPVIDSEKKCLGMDRKLKVVACVLRSLADMFYMLHIIFQLRASLIATVSFGSCIIVGESVSRIRRYLPRYFLIDVLAVLPLPQLVYLVIIPESRGLAIVKMKYLSRCVILLQYIPRFLRVYPLFEAARRTIVITKTTWIGVVFNFSLYILASHIFGAIWYFLSIERQDTCWRDACMNTKGCSLSSLYCGAYDEGRSSYLYRYCPIFEPNSTMFNFGIYVDALQSGVVESTDFPQKFFYCFWWGLQNLGSLGQNLKASTYSWEVAFTASISITGLFLFTLLIGNVQLYLQSNTIRLEKEMRAKLQDAERWMSHISLPENLRCRVRRYEHYKWNKKRGFDDESLLSELPKDLRRDIKRHQIRDLLKRVPVFEVMDGPMLDAICDCLRPVFYTEYIYLVREGHPIEEMVFIMKGKVLSSTDNRGRCRFDNTEILKPGDYCGEELLKWALEPNSSPNLPISTRTVHALTEVEAFVIMADDLKCVASQYTRLQSRKVQHSFRYHSQQWRLWAICFIQSTWRRYLKMKLNGRPAKPKIAPSFLEIA